MEQYPSSFFCWVNRKVAVIIMGAMPSEVPWIVIERRGALNILASNSAEIRSALRAHIDNTLG
jgi:hypothetical protein